MIECPRCHKKFDFDERPGAQPRCPFCGQGAERNAVFTPVDAPAPRPAHAAGVEASRKERHQHPPHTVIPKALIIAGILVVAIALSAAYMVFRSPGSSTFKEAPLWKIGYRWTYAVEASSPLEEEPGDLDGVAKVRVINPYSCVGLPCGYGVRQAFRGSSTWATVDKSDLGWGDRVRYTSHPGIPFPLEAGDRGAMDGYTFQVTYAGPITVAAGDFPAAYAIAYTKENESLTVWYAPEARAPIRMSGVLHADDGTTTTWTSDLRSYEL